MLSFLKRWLITTVSVWAAANLVSGIHADKPSGLFLAALLLGLLNASVRWVMVFWSLPLIILSLGFFLLVINALMLWVVGLVLKDFHVDGFWAAFWGSIIISLTSLILNMLTKNESSNVQVRIHKAPRRPPSDGGDGGPVIDV